MDIKNAKYEVTAVKPGQYPVHNAPEVALVGRSNVGKSSIINTLLNRKNLARESSTPGKTREINFYNVDHALYFVDLPGYGYACVSKAKKATWGEMIESYLYSRNQLKLVIMMVDIRHTPSNEDQVMYEWLINQGKMSLVVATKLDKISRGQVKNRLQDIRATLEMSEGEVVIPFSAETKQGRDEVWAWIKQRII
jgi:GTP-binding protein